MTPSPADLALLTAPLRMAAPRWTSRDIAAATGMSQSAVARAWRRWLAADPCLPPDLPAGLSLRGAWAGGGHMVLAAAITDPAPIGRLKSEGPVMRSPRRCALQTLLAAQLVDSPAIATGVSVMVAADAHTQWLVLGTVPEPADLPASARYICIGTPKWQAALAYLVRTAHLTPAADLLDLQRATVTWAATPVRPFAWSAPPAPTSAFTRLHASSRVSLTAATAQQAVTDQAFERIIARIREGGLTAGDPVTESWLARSLHTTRNQTRDALRTLAGTGLLDLRGSRGVLVPAPTRADVFDTYAARRALGAEVLRRAIANPALDLATINDALAHVLATARTGDSHASGEADLAFQDVVAACSGMRTLPQMMATLARQLRLYIAVLGLGYVYPIEEMVADDTELARCLRARDIAAALRAWDRKIDATLQFMTAHVSRAR